MKLADIKVGETYGVRKTTRKHSTVVPATVIAVDAPVHWTESSRWGDRVNTVTQRDGGIIVKFDQPTRVGYDSFSLAADTNEHAGQIEETYSFHAARNGKSQVPRMFVGYWDHIVARRQAEEEARQAQYADAKAQADEFEPKLNTYLDRLTNLGFRVDVYTDSSGIHGDVDRSISTRHTGPNYSSRRPVGFSYGDVHVDQQVFEFLLQQAEATGVTYKRDHEYEEEEE